MLPRIFWAGDSTVKQNNYTTFPQTGMGQGLPLFLKNEIVIINCAENGRSTKSFITEGRLSKIEQEILEGDILMIQFGHNDEKPEIERHTDPFSTYQAYLEEFVKVAHKKKAHPIFITPLYRRLFDENNLLIENTHLDYPQAMMELGDKLNIPVIDLTTLSKTLIQRAGPEVTKEWFLHIPANRYKNFPEGKEDDTHLQYQGAVIFSGILASELRKLGGMFEELLLPKSNDLEYESLLCD